MVVITISYPHPSRFNYNLASSTSVSPALTDSSSEPLPSLLQVSSDGDTIAATKQGKILFSLDVIYSIKTHTCTIMVLIYPSRVFHLLTI